MLRNKCSISCFCARICTQEKTQHKFEKLMQTQSRRPVAPECHRVFFVVNSVNLFAVFQFFAFTFTFSWFQFLAFSVSLLVSINRNNNAMKLYGWAAFRETAQLVDIILFNRRRLNIVHCPHHSSLVNFKSLKTEFLLNVGKSIAHLLPKTICRTNR